MNKFLCTALVAALGVTLVANDASALGCRKKKANNCCSQSVGYGGYGGGYASGYGGGYGSYASTGCDGCGGTSYATMGGQSYGYTTGQPYGTATYVPGAMPMPMAGSTTTNGVVTASANTPGQQGMITVMVPTADAQVWFEDTQLPQTGKERTFKTPVIADGKSQTFNVKARWTNESGKAVEKTLLVSVKAGQTSTVDFR